MGRQVEDKEVKRILSSKEWKKWLKIVGENIEEYDDKLIYNPERE